MRIHYYEGALDYSTYSFHYSIAATREKEEPLGPCYEQGFLPKSLPNSVVREYYMARSLRVALKDWGPNSENRRVLRMHEAHFDRTVVDNADFDFQDATFQHLALSYIEAVFDLEGTTPHEKLQSILESECIDSVACYRDTQGTFVGYVLIAEDASLSHFWFSFFDLHLQKQSFGLYLMITELMYAQKNTKNHMYLGTCYGTKGRYKCNFNSLEYWNGRKWITDNKILKTLLKKD